MEAASSDMSAASSVDGVSGSDFLNLGMFSSQQQQSQQSQRHGDQQLLVGSSGFGSSSLGLGGSVFNDGASFDLSDFPSLGGSSGAPGSGAPNGISAALRQQHLMQQHGLLAGSNNSSSNKNANNLYRLAMTNNAGVNGTNFSMTTEDFPALQGGGLPMQQQHQQQAPMGSSLLASQRAPSNSNNSAGIYGSSDYADNNSNASDGGLLGGTGLGGLGSLPQQQRSMQQQHQPASSSSRSQQPQQTQHMTAGTAVGSSASTQGGGNALAGDYGLLGLLGIIRMTDADRNALALGSDLTLLGLNLGSTEQIYSTFSSPWSDATVSKDPHFQLPACYYMQPPALKTGHLSKFQLETLFYIFYALPNDVLQAYAAQELYTREWRYHGELKLWFQRGSASDGGSTAPSAQFLYFDMNSWERRLFNGTMTQNITQGFLTEDDIRVKFPSS